MSKLRVLIVDDAVVIRRILTESLSSDPDLEVFTAPNGQIALSKLEQIKPDVVTMDIEMPMLDGIATLTELRKSHPRLPVIMFSTLTERGAARTLDALAAGANDYVTKPSNVGNVGVTVARIREELIPKIKVLSQPIKVALPSRQERPPATVKKTVAPVDIVAIGVSTGGPTALSSLLPRLPRDLRVPIVIVQHMPPVFSKLLADRLDGQSEIEVREGEPGMRLSPGRAIVAPGGFHMALERRGNETIVVTNSEPPENSCRPAVDLLFRSVAKIYGANSLAVILTGMGSDGLKGCEIISAAGGQIVVQDEASSVVWGMPGYVARAGLAEKQLPLTEIADEIVRRVNGGRR